MDEVAALVRQHDHDRYLAALFAPEPKRRHLFALYAFSVEVSRIAGLVSEASLAEIRLQWWLDTLDAIYSGVEQAAPVAQALAAAIRVGNLPKAALVDLAQAHTFDFYSDPMPTRHDLEGYLGETSSVLIQLGAMVLDQDAARRCGEACGLAGVAYGVAQVLNHLPQARRLKQCFLPAEGLAEHGVRPSSMYEPTQGPRMAAVLADITAFGEQRLAELRGVGRTISPSVAPAFLHASLSEAYFAKARKQSLAVMNSGCEISPLRKQWRLWRAARDLNF
jgi:15-cis-phytoene synthase